MAAISSNKLSLISVPTPLAVASLTGSDTLTYDSLSDQILFLGNSTVSAITVTLDGNQGTTVPVSNTGGDTFDVSHGKQITVPAGELVGVRLSTISAYLTGAVSVTGGSGLYSFITTSF